MKLTSIENLRKDGIFYDDRGHIPEGKIIRLILEAERDTDSIM
jgi:hypothetical protein